MVRSDSSASMRVRRASPYCSRIASSSSWITPSRRSGPGEDVGEVADQLEQLAVLAEDLVLLETGEPVQPQVEDRLGLHLGEPVAAVVQPELGTEPFRPGLDLARARQHLGHDAGGPRAAP